MDGPFHERTGTIGGNHWLPPMGDFLPALGSNRRDALRCATALNTRVGLMADTLTEAQRSERMARVRGRDTKPERALRALLTRLGHRYRLQARDLPGRPDIVFRGKRRAIFVHGCFWHRHPDPECKLARMPKSRLDFWGPKLEANRARDVANIDRLKALGWRVLLVWECELRDMDRLEDRVSRFVEGVHEGD